MERTSDTKQPESYVLTRFVFLRFLGLVYFAAFYSLSSQLEGLFGKNGILPISRYLQTVALNRGAGLENYLSLPTLLWANSSDEFMWALAMAGVVLSVALIAGAANVWLLVSLWAIYLSFVNAGQVFYGYGWETLLLETGFLSIFLVPFWNVRPFRAKCLTPIPVVWLFRWLLFRLLLGAGLIKIRSSDSCWRELTCLIYHYETQPLPNPLSWYFHHIPARMHHLGALFNHFVELVVPWSFFCFGRLRPLRIWGGVFSILFQFILILSGNLSWLNYLTIVISIFCFDDQAFNRFFPKGFRESLPCFPDFTPARTRKVTTWLITLLIATLSFSPAMNLVSPHQLMNASFDPFHIVNTYGAFGSVGRERYEVILEGTADKEITPETKWVEYEFKCKPGDISRRPCVVAPFQLRLDWQIWFAAMEDLSDNPWLIRLTVKLLQGEPSVIKLLDSNPFPNSPPRQIRAELYRYRFTEPGDTSGNWWRRERVSSYMPPVTLRN